MLHQNSGVPVRLDSIYPRNFQTMRRRTINTDSMLLS